MPLATPGIARLETFLERIATETYPEPVSDLHDAITGDVMERALQLFNLPAGARVLDVGCGQGVALKRFVARGFRPIGITLNAIDVAACQDAGYDVRQMDQSFLEFEDGAFDLVWCRHCLEHSIFPYFTLDGFRQVLAPGGCLYVEVPAPDTACRHQTNGNHYSVLGRSMLGSLIMRSGFEIVDTLEVNFSTMAGPDTYWGFIARRRA
jgi:SAM-dependent methyltransferase